MRVSSPVFGGRDFFHSPSVMLDDFPQLENGGWVRNCASVLLSLLLCIFIDTLQQLQVCTLVKGGCVLLPTSSAFLP